jgi:hypothetical protein
MKEYGNKLKNTNQKETEQENDLEKIKMVM